ncbi:MAG: ABC transporter ATP-binding protein [Bacillales bacterium]|jgi:iron complex transport system ATP-binding protein|uniref:Iron ABC transporter ATP-binding protein n=1 Tax=Novibacillus thermophilus TaxID=1471761 RepID=A0A1U9K4W1_9BACL|nr:ABC transporter ATP-binding protein [Novibacillus thermophilus]AQS55085.1 iron ABC transporter ATP-binding protein [Novibacillus thermophilus]
MVSVKNVFKRYSGKNVVDNVSVTIQKGKITSFIGPNGAGKSTLISMISRLIAKDGGEIYIEEKEIGKCKSHELAKKISILKQTNHINLRLTVRELVSFGRFPYSQGRLTQDDWDHVDSAIQYMGLEDIQHKYLDQLSGGQRQRAYIAMVIAQDTDYILLDEPLNNLDMKHSVQIMKTLRRLVDELGKTIVIVIHDINFASVYSDYIVALKDGKIVKEGPTEEIINQPALKEIYDMDISVRDINRCKICVYFS